MEYCYEMSNSAHDKFMIFGNLDLTVEKGVSLLTLADQFVSRKTSDFNSDSLTTERELPVLHDCGPRHGCEV